MKPILNLILLLFLSSSALFAQFDEALARANARNKCLEYIMRSVNMNLPDSSSGVICYDSIAIERMRIVNHYTVFNEENYNSIKKKAALYRNQLLQYFNDISMREIDFILYAVKNDNMELEYRYCNSMGNDSLSILFTADDLALFTPIDISSVCRLFEFSDESGSASITKNSVILKLNTPDSQLPSSLETTLNQFVQESFAEGDVYDIYLFISLYAELDFRLELCCGDNSVSATITNEELKKRAVSQIENSSLKSDTVPFSSLTKKPMFNGKGVEEFGVWVSNNLRYPEIAKRNKTYGRVVVRFIIEKDGTLSNAKVFRKTDPALDQEALRVVRLSPKWTPGEVDGKPVRVSFFFPVIFQMHDFQKVSK